MPVENQTNKSTFTKKIGRGIYKINIYFNENSKESFNDKLFRLIQNDIAKNANAVNQPHSVPNTAQGDIKPLH